MRDRTLAGLMLDLIDDAGKRALRIGMRVRQKVRHRIEKRFDAKPELCAAEDDRRHDAVRDLSARGAQKLVVRDLLALEPALGKFVVVLRKDLAGFLVPTLTRPDLTPRVSLFLYRVERQKERAERSAHLGKHRLRIGTPMRKEVSGMVILKYELKRHRKYILGWAIALAQCVFVMHQHL